VAPLAARAGWDIAVTESEVVAIRARDGQIVWRRAAGGVRLAPAIDEDLLYLGAEDGRVLALNMPTGDVVWEKYVEKGVTALAAYRGLLYVGAGDKQFYCFAGHKKGALGFPTRLIGAAVIGHIAVDDERVYFGALDNVVRALDRSSGNQRWTHPMRVRVPSGVLAIGHVVFVPAPSKELVMLYDRDGLPSGTIVLPDDLARDALPDISLTDGGRGIAAFVVTGGLANNWQLTSIGPVSETPDVAMNAMDLPGLPYLTDPLPAPIGRVLGSLIMGDPVLYPSDAIGWPVILQDPPLESFTVIPGIQLRPLSPVLPPRRGGSGPAVTPPPQSVPVSGPKTRDAACCARRRPSIRPERPAPPQAP
jgi:hypothetical protein